MGIKVKRRPVGPKKGRTKKFGENVSITVWKNKKGFCSACHSFKSLRLKILIKKPTRQDSYKIYYHSTEYFVCDKKCRTMILLQNI